MAVSNRELKKKGGDLYLSDKPPLTTSGKVGLGFTYVILIVFVLIILWPIYQIIVNSFNGAQARNIIIGGGFQFSLKNFEYLFNRTNYLHWVKNTIFIGVVTAIITVIIVSFTGYAFSRFRFKGKRMSLLLIMLIQVIPTFAGITAYFTLHQIIVGVVPFFSRQMLLILIYAGGGIASNTFILKGYMDSISPELDEAAHIDGSSNMQTYRLIIMPLVRPMLAIIALWSFIIPFLDYMLPSILLNNSQDYTLATGLFTLINDPRTMHQPAFAAGGLLTAIPIVAFFMLLQNQLVSGLAAGSVKG